MAAKKAKKVVKPKVAKTARKPVPARGAKKEAVKPGSNGNGKTKTSGNGVTAVEKEILDVTGCKPREKGETFDEYAGRVAEAVDDSEGAWEKLSKPAQKWFADAAEASNAQKAMPAFPTDAAAPAEKPTKKKEAAAAEPAPAKQKAKGGNGKEKPARERKQRSNLTAEGMAIACKDLSLGADDGIKEAKKAKINVAESQMRNAFRLTHLVARVMREVGLLKR